MSIPTTLKPYFQEYILEDLQIRRDADLIIQRTLEFGNWIELRWLFQTYRRERIRCFLREHGVRWLNSVTFNYWRKLLGVRQWKAAPFEKIMNWPP